VGASIATLFGRRRPQYMPASSK